MPDHQRSNSGSHVDTKDPTDHFFFLISFLAVIIFAMARYTISLANLKDQLDLFAKAIIPLVILGAWFGYNKKEIELSKPRTVHLFGQKKIIRLTLRLSTVVLSLAFLIEIYFVVMYVYL
jgi:hypothetical protein